MKNDIRINVKDLHPRLRLLLQKLVELSNAQGVYLIVTEGFRTAKKQDELYAQGRTKSGKIVTNAKGNSYQSQHQWGIAFDIAIANPGHTWDTAYFKKVGALSNKIKGLSWGGNWVGFTDLPHFYLDEWGSTPTTLIAKYKTPEAFKKTWYKTVTGTKKGLSIWSRHKTKRLHKKCPNGTVFEIVRYGKKWNKVVYNDVVGYSLAKYLK